MVVISARLEIKSYNAKEYYCALKQVRCKGDPETTKPTLHPTTLTELDAGAQLDAGKLLKDVEATMVAMRDDIIGKPAGGPTFACATFRRTNKLVPVEAKLGKSP